MSDIDYSFKLTLVGESNVGKTSILYKFVDDTFYDNYIKFLTKKINILN